MAGVFVVGIFVAVLIAYGVVLAHGYFWGKDRKDGFSDSTYGD